MEILTRSKFKPCSISGCIFLSKNTTVSSAKFLTLERFKQLSKSLKDNKNKIRPRIKPWETPQLIGQGVDLWLSISLICTLLNRQSSNHFIVKPFMLYGFIFDNKRAWLRVSKAFDRSIYKASAILPLLICLLISFTRYKVVSSVECFIL